MAVLGEAPLALRTALTVRQQCCSSPRSPVAVGLALSESSSGSRWSETCAVEQQQGLLPGFSWPSQAALQEQGHQSVPTAAVQRGAAAAAAAATTAAQLAGGMPWQLHAPLTGSASLAAGNMQGISAWQQRGVEGHGSGSTSSVAAPLQPPPIQQQPSILPPAEPGLAAAASTSMIPPLQPPQALPPLKPEPCSTAAVEAGVAASPGGEDPWQCGLDLLIANTAAEVEHISDASLDALLAPFEEWPCLLQPPPAAGAPTQAPDAPQALTQQPQMQQQQHTGSAAVAAPPRQMATAVAPGPHVAPAAAPTQHPAMSADSLHTSSRAAASLSSGPATTHSGSDGSSDASGGSGGKAPRKKGGRPRVHYPTAPSAAAVAGTAGASPAPAGEPFKKSGRGPKPKYVFSTKEEATDARRERNRKAALQSYYRKKEHTQRLQAEVAALQSENAALQGLLTEMNLTGLCPLPEASQEGIDTWLQHLRGAAGSHP